MQLEFLILNAFENKIVKHSFESNSLISTSLNLPIQGERVWDITKEKEEKNVLYKEW